MDPRYAFFIWASFGVVGLAVVWNAASPWLARKAIRQRLLDAADDRDAVTTEA